MVITKNFEIRFYRETSGKEPVLEWIKEFRKKEQKIIGHDIKRIQYT